MALRDLIAVKAALTEDSIESIVKGYITFDPDAKEVVLMPPAAALPTKSKILIYLVALQGWSFVAPELEIASSVKPSELEKHLNIPGGTLRPILMELKDRHLVTARDGAYSVRGSALAAIKSELEGSSSASRQPARRVRKREKQRADDQDSKDESPNGRGRTRSSGRKRSVSALFASWIAEGWFNEPKGLADVMARFRKEGIMIARTGIPKLFLKALDDEQLTRDEVEVGGKKIWKYQTRR